MVSVDASDRQLDETLTVAPHVHWQRFDNELVVLDLKASEYLGMNEVAADAFERLALGKSLRMVIRELSSIYDVDIARVQVDVVQLVAELVSAGLLLGHRSIAPIDQ
ncbi:MAG: PqqD family protein [Polyangiaceae bacterium]|jgi:hypothetical protein